MQDNLAFLHTADVHVSTFARLAAEANPGLSVRHVVHPGLLESARKEGVTERLIQQVHAAMAEAASGGARVVVCTCSTIGGIAEKCPGRFRAMRIDRPMADFAVRRGKRILVIAALESTLAPTVNLLTDSAYTAKVEIQTGTLLVENAWVYFERGDHEEYVNAIARAIRANSSGYDVAVLAQASMSAAADRCAGIGIPVLSSPRVGVEAAIEASFA